MVLNTIVNGILATAKLPNGEIVSMKFDNVSILLDAGNHWHFKKCSKCWKNKYLYSEFHKRYYGKKKKKAWATFDNYRAQCKDCYNTQRRKRAYIKRQEAKGVFTLPFSFKIPDRIIRGDWISIPLKKGEMVNE